MYILCVYRIPWDWSWECHVSTGNWTLGSTKMLFSEPSFQPQQLFFNPIEIEHTAHLWGFPCLPRFRYSLCWTDCSIQWSLHIPCKFPESLMPQDSSWSFPFPLFGSSSPALSTHPQQGASNILHSINIQAVPETPQWAGNAPDFLIHLCFRMCCWVQEARSLGIFEHTEQEWLCAGILARISEVLDAGHKSREQKIAEKQCLRSPRGSLLQSHLTSDFSLLRVLITMKRIQQGIPSPLTPHPLSSRGLMAKRKAPLYISKDSVLKRYFFGIWMGPPQSISKWSLESGKVGRWREGSKNVIAVNWDRRLVERQDPPPDS